MTNAHLPLRATALALFIGAAFPAAAQSNEEILKELRALRERVNQLESKLVQQQQAAPTPGQWGMTPEQARELSRVTVKTEAMEDNAEASGFKGLKISGVIDPTYIVNRNQGTASFAFLNNFAGTDVFAYDNSYFGMAVIDFQKELEGGTRWRLTLAPHKSVGSNYNFPSIVHEASVSIPLGDLQSRFWAGQIPDWSGYEYFLAHQTKLITHNLLFDFLAPTYYTGIGTDFTSGKWIVKTALGNINSSRNNPGDDGTALRSPGLSVRVDYSRGEFSGWGSSVQYGRVTNNVAGGTSELINGEVDAYYTRGDITLQGQLSYGTQAAAAFNGGGSRWVGLSGTAAYKITPRLEVVSRLDYIDNSRNGGGTFNIAFATDAGGLATADGRNGFGPGMVYDDTTGTWGVGDPTRGANRSAFSLGTSYVFMPGVLFKAEYRYDRASQPVFIVLPDGSWRQDNHLLGASVVVSF